MVLDEYSIHCDDCKGYNISPVRCEDCWKKKIGEKIDFMINHIEDSDEFVGRIPRTEGDVAKMNIEVLKDVKKRLGVEE